MIPRFRPHLGWGELGALFLKKNDAVERFEREFADKFEAVDAVAFSYGRAAQWAFLKSMGISEKEIIMPAYTCSVVAHAVTLSQNIPKFVDINLEDYNMNFDEVERAINKNTGAIIATHTFGYPQDIEKLEEIVTHAQNKFGTKIYIVQDCCHAFGATSNNNLIGTSGDVAVYGLNISKMITSIFGGILTFQDQTVADQVRSWRNENFSEPTFTKALSRRIYLLAVYIAFNKNLYFLTHFLANKTKFLNRFTKSYHMDNQIHFPPDFKQKMSNVEAQVGSIQLKKYDEIIRKRRQITEIYNENLIFSDSFIKPIRSEGATYSHYVVRVNPDQRENLKLHWSKKGIELGELIQYCIPSLLEYADSNTEKFMNSELCSVSMLNFPVTVEDVDDLKKKLCNRISV